MFAKALLNNFKKEQNNWLLSFKLFWKNSWRNDTNFDGTYVFIKYKTKGSKEYYSATFSKTSEGEFDCGDKLPDNCKIGDSSISVGAYIPATALGMFVFPLVPCNKEEILIDDIQVTLHMEEDIEDIQLFALEMVYIPEGKHYIGDPKNGISKGGFLKNCFYTYPDKGAYLVESEDAISFAPKDGNLYCDLDTPNGRQEEDTFEIPASFPKGYQAMWYMKYSLTEAQYVQFLNCLSRKQQQSHVMSDISSDTIDQYYVMTNTNTEKDRAAIICRRTGNGETTPVTFYTAAANRAVNSISYHDVSAFACFAGLRPITELEYEKAARGTLPAVSGEFAWGTTNIGRVFHFDGIDGSGLETPISQIKGMLCNCNFGTGIAPFEKDNKESSDNPGWEGPVSVGVFENSPVLEGYTERECTGASYYGVMEMCGNVWENLISVGRAQGRAFV
jgi:formylglycine-generating enzyme required for sulfatase activity